MGGAPIIPDWQDYDLTVNPQTPLEHALFRRRALANKIRRLYKAGKLDESPTEQLDALVSIRDRHDPL